VKKVLLLLIFFAFLRKNNQKLKLREQKKWEHPDKKLKRLCCTLFSAFL